MFRAATLSKRSFIEEAVKCLLRELIKPPEEKQVFHDCVRNVTTEEGETPAKLARVEDLHEQYDAEPETEQNNVSIAADDCSQSTSTAETAN